MTEQFNNRILVIDDDESILSIFKSVLSRAFSQQGSRLSELKSLISRGQQDAGKEKQKARYFQVDTAIQGQTGFEMVKEACDEGNPYSVIFVDMRMPPGWDGVQTVKAIRDEDPTVQIVIVTAYSDATIDEIVNQVGFTDRLLYLKKPFDDQEILQLAESLATRWNLEKRLLYFDDVLESIIATIGELDFINNQNSLKFFLEKILLNMGELLCTPDLLLAKVVDGQFQFKVGTGLFANGIAKTEAFQAVLARVLKEKKVDELFQVDDYLIMPISLRICQNVVVGVMNLEAKHSDRFLSTMAASSANLFKQGARLADLCLEVEKLRERERELLKQNRQLAEDGTKK